MLNEHRTFFLKQVTPDVQPGTTKMYKELNFEGKRIIRPAYKNVLDDLAYIPIKKR